MQKEKQKLINSLTEKIIDFEAEKLIQSSEKINGINFIIAKFENRPVDELKIFARKFLNTSNTVSVLGSKTDGANVIMTRSPEIEIDLREILKEVLSIIEGRGGGKADFVQCGGSAENFEKMFDITVEKLKTKLS
jgi:alanyl-tRNA synthetase